MFTARCIGVSLAVIVLVYVSLSVAVGRGWKLIRGIVQPRTARGASDLLFVLRVLPLVMSTVVTLAFTLPSFLLLEPRATDEEIGSAPLVLGFCCLLLIAVGITRAVRAQLKASRALVKWLDGSILMES